MWRKNLGLLWVCGTLPVACVLPKIDTDFRAGGSAGAAGTLRGNASSAARSSPSSGGSNALGGGGGGPANTSGGMSPGAGGAGSTMSVIATGGAGGTSSPDATGGAVNTPSAGGTSGVIATGGTLNTPSAGGESFLNPAGGMSAAAGATNVATGGVVLATAAAGSAGGVATGGAPNTGGTTSGPPTPIGVTTGWLHSCALLPSGAVRCWGSEYCGALGNGNGNLACAPNDLTPEMASAESKQTTPVAVDGITDATSLFTGNGGLHNCVIDKSKKVRCWGWNEFGQLGDGFTHTSSATPVSVQSLSGAESLAPSYVHTCALLSDATVRCWGANASGELGDSSSDDSATPTTTVMVRDAQSATGYSPLTNVASISSGWWHTCAVVKTDNSVWCWGNNYSGQLGDGTKTDKHYAVKTPFQNAVEVKAGGEFTCARNAAGAISCWGYNGDGELGNGLFVDSPTPTQVEGIASGSTMVATGGYHACAVLGAVGSATNSVSCWGYNSDGQLGNGGTERSATPVPIPSFSSVTQVAADTNHTCALSAGEVYCWGQGAVGQLGVGNTASTGSPKKVTVP